MPIDYSKCCIIKAENSITCSTGYYSTISREYQSVVVKSLQPILPSSGGSQLMYSSKGSMIADFLIELLCFTYSRYMLRI